MAQIEVDKLHKAFGDFVAVEGSSFTVQSGEFFCLLGPSGCGDKTDDPSNDRGPGVSPRQGEFCSTGRTCRFVARRSATSHSCFSSSRSPAI